MPTTDGNEKKSKFWSWKFENRNALVIARFTTSSFALGCLAPVLAAFKKNSFLAGLTFVGISLMWILACYAAGSSIGFLFAVPRIRPNILTPTVPTQPSPNDPAGTPANAPDAPANAPDAPANAPDAPANAPDAPTNGPDAPGGVASTTTGGTGGTGTTNPGTGTSGTGSGAGSGGANAGVTAATDTGIEHLQVNSNLVEVSDWLTKIVVGLGLVELRVIPDHLRWSANYVAEGLGERYEFSSYAMALILYFSLIGFLWSYLMTRLFLYRAFGNAEGQPDSPRA